MLYFLPVLSLVLCPKLDMKLDENLCSSCVAFPLALRSRCASPSPPWCRSYQPWTPWSCQRWTTSCCHRRSATSSTAAWKSSTSVPRTRSSCTGSQNTNLCFGVIYQVIYNLGLRLLLLRQQPQHPVQMYHKQGLGLILVAMVWDPLGMGEIVIFITEEITEDKLIKVGDNG